MPSSNVLLPFGLPDTKSLRRAAANILRDIQRDNEETDQCTDAADALSAWIGSVERQRLRVVA